MEIEVGNLRNGYSYVRGVSQAYSQLVSAQLFLKKTSPPSLLLIFHSSIIDKFLVFRFFLSATHLDLYVCNFQVSSSSKSISEFEIHQ